MADTVCTTSAEFVTALGAASGGDTITLTAGNTFDTASGFVLPVHTGAAITVRSSALANLPAGKRVNPGDLAKMPLLRSTASNIAVFTITASAVTGWTLVGLAITTTHDTQQQGLVQFPSAIVQTAASQLPHDIVIDRCLVYGKAGNVTASAGTIRGLALNAVNLTVTNCYIYDFRYDGADSQAIYVQQATNVLIQNNYLSGGGENIIFGGSNTSIDGFVTSDVQVRYNHLAKDPRWNVFDPVFGSVAGSAVEVTPPNTITGTGTSMSSTSHGATTPNVYAVKINSTGEIRRITAIANANDFTIASAFSSDPSGAAWTRLHSWYIKNLFEIKVGERFLVEGNLMERCWPLAQDGRAVLMSTLNDTTTSPWHRVKDIRFTHNWLRNVTKFFYASAFDPFPPSESNYTVQTAGVGTLTTVGTAATFSQAHGLSINDMVRMTSGADTTYARKVTATPLSTTATLAAAFPHDQVAQSWEKWTVKVVSQGFLVEHNVVENMGKGENGYYWNGTSLGTGTMGLFGGGPANITMQHNTLSYTDPEVDATFYLGETGEVIDIFVIKDNIASAADNDYNGTLTASGIGNNANNAMSTFTTNGVFTGNVFYGADASATNKPAGNSWETDVANVGWDNQAQARFVLTSGTHRAGQANDATDNTDVGANVTLTRARVFGRHSLGQGW